MALKFSEFKIEAKRILAPSVHAKTKFLDFHVGIKRYTLKDYFKCSRIFIINDLIVNHKYFAISLVPLPTPKKIEKKISYSKKLKTPNH